MEKLDKRKKIWAIMLVRSSYKNIQKYEYKK